MTLRSLEIFLAVVKHGKMSVAAAELHISQPTISQTIAELEKEYGVILFDRLSKKLYITDAGRQLSSYAINILSLVDEMEKNMANLASRKTILLGVTITVGKTVLVDIVKTFEQLHPNTEIQVTIDNTGTIERLLLNSQIDIGFIEGNIKSPELTVIPAIPDSLVLACHPQHPIAKKRSINIEDLSEYPFVLREEESGTRELFEDNLKKHNVQINIKWNCHDADLLLEAVMANQGLTVISKRLADPHVKAEKLCIVPISGINMNRNFSLVFHKTKYISKTLQEFIDFILKK